MYKPANLDDLAYDVYSGKYGNSTTRKLLLGDLYIPVQNRVNEIWKLTCGHPEIWIENYILKKRRVNMYVPIYDDWGRY